MAKARPGVFADQAVIDLCGSAFATYADPAVRRDRAVVQSKIALSPDAPALVVFDNDASERHYSSIRNSPCLRAPAAVGYC